MTMEEWIEKYNKKTPEPFKRNHKYAMLYHPEKGFCEIGQTEDMIIINQLAGDGRFWKNTADRLGQALHVKMGGTWCIRNAILAYIRLFGFVIERTEDVGDGLKRYYCRNKRNGKKGLASPAFRYDSGEQAYYITWEV